MQNPQNRDAVTEIDYRQVVQQAKVNRARYLSRLFSHLVKHLKLVKSAKPVHGHNIGRSPTPGSRFWTIMNFRDPASLMFIISIVFAGMILLASNLLGGNELADNVTWTLVAFWFVPMGILLERAAKGVSNK